MALFVGGPRNRVNHLCQGLVAVCRALFDAFEVDLLPIAGVWRRWASAYGRAVAQTLVRIDFPEWSSRSHPSTVDYSERGHPER